MKLFTISMLILLFVPPAQAVQIIPKDDYTCFEFSIAYAKENPDWGIVTISNNPLFRGTSHMVNYKFTENNTLMIHDGLYQYDYEIFDWQDAYFYHFWLENETPCKNYKVLRDNSHLFTEKV